MKPKKVPERMCVGCQEMKPKKEFVRIVRTPAGEIVLDTSGKKAGRGVYVCSNNAACLAKAIKERKIERALKHEISVEIYEELKLKIGQDL